MLAVIPASDRNPTAVQAGRIGRIYRQVPALVISAESHRYAQRQNVTGAGYSHRSRIHRALAVFQGGGTAERRLRPRGIVVGLETDGFRERCVLQITTVGRADGVPNKQVSLLNRGVT